MEAIKTRFTITYEGKDVTASLLPYIVEITYEDSIEGESSGLDITLENEDGLWSNEWYPQKGDIISLKIEDLNCGNFMIDEPELTGPPDYVVIKALENMIDKPVRTEKTKTHKGKTILQIAQAVAQANKLTLVANGVPNIVINKVSQRKETDLKFLRRVSYDFGIIFSVRDGKLIYSSLYDNDLRDPVFIVQKTDLTSYTLKDKTSGVFKKARVSYFVPKTGKKISHTVEDTQVKTVRNADNISYKLIEKPDTLVIKKRVENKQQAEAIAKSHLYRANSEQQGGSIGFPGNMLAVAGNNFELQGLGDAGSGIFNIKKVRHNISRDNDWACTAEIKRVAVVDKEKQKAITKNSQAAKPIKATTVPGLVVKQPTQVTDMVNRDGIIYKKVVPVIK